jgi:hypothetical protein
MVFGDTRTLLPASSNGRFVPGSACRTELPAFRGLQRSYRASEPAPLGGGYRRRLRRPPRICRPSDPRFPVAKVDPSASMGSVAGLPARRRRQFLSRQAHSRPRTIVGSRSESCSSVPVTLDRWRGTVASPTSCSDSSGVCSMPVTDHHLLRTVVASSSPSPHFGFEPQAWPAPRLRGSLRHVSSTVAAKPLCALAPDRTRTGADSRPDGTTSSRYGASRSPCV